MPMYSDEPGSGKPGGYPGKGHPGPGPGAIILTLAKPGPVHGFTGLRSFGGFCRGNENAKR